MSNFEGGIPQRPPIPPKVEKLPEPVQAEVQQSERVEDVAKAEEMARASKKWREEAIEDRKIASGEIPIEDTGEFKIIRHGGPLVSKFDRNMPDEAIRTKFAESSKANDERADAWEKIASEEFKDEKK